MRIAYIRTQYSFGLKAGGSVGHTSGVINALNNKVDLDVFSNDELYNVHSGINVVKPVLKSNSKLFKDIFELINNIKWIFKFKNLKKYDAIYHRYSAATFAVGFIANKNKIPLILEFNSSEVWKLQRWYVKEKSMVINFFKRVLLNWIKLPVIRRIEEYNLKNASLIVVVSEALFETLMSNNINPDKILINPNGVDPEKYSDKLDGSIIRHKYKLDKNIVIGFIGTFGKWHGVIQLATAICIFYKMYPNLRRSTTFLLIGDGILRHEVEKIIENANLKNHVILTGLVPQNEAIQYLSACDIFTSPHIPNPDGTKFFGSPTKLFEYMALGKPIIASNLDQIGQILQHGKTAYLVEPGNTKALSKSFYTLINDKTLRRKLGIAARQDVITRYTWDKHVERILDRLDNIKKTV